MSFKLFSMKPVRLVLFCGLLILLLASCKTLPPSIMLDNSTDPAYWYTSALKIKAFNTSVTVRPSVGDTISANAKDSIGEHFVYRGRIRQIVSTDFVSQGATVATPISNEYQITNLAGTICSDCFSTEMIYRRKLYYGDVIYLITGDHFQVGPSQFFPDQNTFRIPIRHTTENANSLKDYEKSFLNLVMTTHVSMVPNDYGATYNPATIPNNKITQLINAYTTNREKIWNALMENIYYQYSDNTGYSIVVDIEKINPLLTTDIAPATYRYNYMEIISRPKVLQDEIQSLLSRSTTGLPPHLTNKNYYSASSVPTVFYLSSVELNGVKLTAQEIENKTWNVEDWKESRIGYLIKYDGSFEIPISRLLLKKQATSNAGNYKLILNPAQANKSLSSPIVYLRGPDSANKGSRYKMPDKATWLFQTVIYISSSDLRNITTGMLRKKTLRKYFHLK